MTVPTVAPPRRNAVSVVAGPLSIAMLLAGLVLAVATVAVAVFAPDTRVRLEWPTPATTTTTTIVAPPAQTVGLIAPACATIDPARFPCPAGVTA